MFSLRVLDRNGGLIAPPATVRVEPLRWSGDVLGGPRSAAVRMTGALTALLPLTAWLGYRLRIVGPEGQEVWWGDVEEVTITRSGIERGVTLAGVANRINILYTLVQPGGSPAAAETGWADDLTSQALYGLRERRHSASTPMTAAQAVQMRTTLLQRVSLPQQVRRMPGSGDEVYATLRCVGMVQRLANVYAANNTGLAEHPATGAGWPLGLGFTSDFVAFVRRDNKNSIHQLYGRFAHFGEYTDLQMRVSGSTGNDGAFTVTGGDAKKPVSYTATTIKFIQADDIEDSTPGLAPFESDDVIQISGSALNSGTHLVKTPGPSRIEISPGFAGDTIQHEMPGPSITILRGNSVAVTETVANGHAGPTVTVSAYGQEIYQTFVPGGGSAWNVHAVEIGLRKVGAPTDAVMVTITANSGGSPGTILETITVDDANIPAELEWISFPFSNALVLAAATTYGILVRRTGAADSDNYYEVSLDKDAGYGLGALKLYDGAAWQSPALAKSLCFRVLGGMYLENLIQLIVARTGEFGGELVEATSGLVVNQYREGKQTALDEVEALLDTGISDGTRLMLTVMRTEHVRIHGRAAAASARLVYRDPKVLLDLQGQPFSPGVLPVGEWVQDDDAYMLTGALASLSPFFVARAEYGVDTGWRLEPEGQPDPWEVGAIDQG